VRPFIPRGGSLDGDTVLEIGIQSRIGLTHVSDFGIGAGVTLLFVTFFERGSGKCRDREAFGRDASYIGGTDVARE